jgi:hypothetical protein
MIKVFCDDKEKKAHLQCILPSTNLDIGLNMGGKRKRTEIIINSDVGIMLSNNRDSRRRMVQRHFPTFRFASSDDDYPLIIKASNKNNDFLEDKLVIECKKEFRVFSEIFKDVVLEREVVPTSEYLICSTQDKVFSSLQLARKKKFIEELFIPHEGYEPKFEFNKPMLWFKIIKDIPLIVKEMRLDFATFKITINEDDLYEKISIFGIAPTIPLYESVISDFGSVLEGIIKDKTYKISKLKEKPLNI